MNPIKKIRSSLGLTQQELASYAGISSQGVLRYEQSLYEEPSAKLVTALTELVTAYELDLLSVFDRDVLESLGLDPSPGATRNLIIGLYHQDRTEIQHEAEYLFRHPHSVTKVGNEHPFVTWRTKCLDSDSRMRFCIMLAVHPSVVAEYEKGKRRYMPRLLREALVTAAVGNDLLDQLDYAGSIFYDSLKHRR